MKIFSITVYLFGVILQITHGAVEENAKLATKYGVKGFKDKPFFQIQSNITYCSFGHLVRT